MSDKSSLQSLRGKRLRIWLAAFPLSIAGGSLGITFTHPADPHL
jgi:hypothetical protein